MKVVKFIILLFVFGFGATMKGEAQCRTEIRFYLVHKNGKKINLSKVIAGGTDRVNSTVNLAYEIDIEGESGKELILEGECATGEEDVSMIYRGAEMKIRFKFTGDVGTVRGKIVFRKGSYIAEPQKPYSSERFEGIRIRRATKEEAEDFAI